MANTIQKKIKFSKGQIVPELVERTDLALYDSSAQNMKNVVSTIYGGVRSRRGTKYIDYITSINEKTPSSITSDFTNDTTHFTDTTLVSFGQITTKRKIAQIDYGSNDEGASRIQIKGLKLSPYSITLNSATSQDITLDNGDWDVIITGGGGGSRHHGEVSGTNSAYYTSGGSAGGFAGVLQIPAGTYSVVVGSGGYGNGAGNASSFGSFVVAGGGGASSGWGNSDGWKAGPVIGAGGSISVNGTVVSQRIRSVGNSGGARINNGSGVRTAPAVASVLSSLGISNGGVPSFTYAERYEGDPPVDLYGNSGYFKITRVNPTAKVIVSVSENDDVYDIVSENIVGTSPIDIVVDLQKSYRYVSVYIDANESLTSGLSFSYIRNDISSVENVGDYGVRLIDFVYSDVDKHLICLTENTIQIFKDDTLIKVIENTGIRKEHLPEIKWSSKDDTVVFTHKNLKTKILKRLSGGNWTYGDLGLKNIPYAVFGEETEENKTTGITPSELEGAVKITADSAIFSDAWVGQYIDGNGGRVKITEYVSGTVVNGYTVIPFYTTDKISNWTYISGYEPVWSETRGYPRTCLFSQQRLWFGGSKDKPATVWASRLGDYFNFKNSGNYDNDSIDVDLLTNDPIVNMIDNRGLHIFTTGEEMTVSENSYTPDSFSVVTNTRNGSYPNIKPVVFGGIVGFIEKNGKSLLGYVYDYNQASYMTENISLFSNLINHPVSMSAEINSSKDKGDFLFLVLSDGTMLVMCVSLNEDVKSISQFKTDGKIIDVCCLKDSIYLLVERNNTVCLEKIIENQVDCENNYSVVGGVVGGLYLFNNKYVYVKLGSGKIFKRKVENNSINIDVDEQTCNVGIAYEYELESNPIAINGKTVDIKKRISSATLHCKDTPQITFNNQLKKDKDIYNFYACTKYDNDVRFKINGEFYPMEILSVVLNINYEG